MGQDSISIYPDWNVSSKIVASTSTRGGGISTSPYDSLNFAEHVGDNDLNVKKNIELYTAQFNSALRWQWLNQIHGVETKEVTQVSKPINADGLLTREAGLVCCVLTADCLPVFFAAQDGSEIAIAHAGWRGLAAGILKNTLDKFSVPVEEVSVWLGPAIGFCHFEVGTEVKELFVSQADSMAEKMEIQQCFSAVKNSQKHMADLAAIAKLKLANLGLHQVSGGSHCTYCNSRDFYSFRRDGTTGRMLNIIYIDPDSS
ncbi:MAG: hypothetical protein COA96_17465 [SAR86 cluster bacterium]|uniref:Purine nucleoside phosphorylase n=1 Tax=SAR86 cluster bacterium TaxID=2030880 RepID=A0A2A5AFD6_9GAMM|nr:MAG: hypothetical protein COA96_17465 [SAR86 cluster bacterium]